MGNFNEFVDAVITAFLNATPLGSIEKRASEPAETDGDGPDRERIIRPVAPPPPAPRPRDFTLAVISIILGPISLAGSTVLMGLTILSQNMGMGLSGPICGASLALGLVAWLCGALASTVFAHVPVQESEEYRRASRAKQAAVIGMLAGMVAVISAMFSFCFVVSTP